MEEMYIGRSSERCCSPALMNMTALLTQTVATLHCILQTILVFTDFNAGSM